MDDNSSNKEKKTKEVLGDYVQEIVGYDNVLLRTLIDLYKKPAIVLKSYIDKEQKYVSPFRILFATLTFWVLVNSFILDWHEVLGKYRTTTTEWVERNFEISKRDEEFEAKVSPIFYKLLEDYLSKYFVPFWVIFLPIVSFFTSIRGKRYGADFKTLLAASSYMYSTAIIWFFSGSLFMYFNMFYLLLILVIPLTVLQFMGKVSFMSLKSFFPSHGPKIHREFMLVSNILFVLITLPLVFFWKFII